MSASEDKKASEAAASAKPTGLENCTIIARDDFEIHERVGQGAFGMVYRGTWRRNGEKLTVALKRVATVRQEVGGFVLSVVFSLLLLVR
ncbi:unnamed protein product [Anisakis simplex]|uniref:Protein kinase domain-containing protein n=1 Tax=Anisakis simplex TaxID=6269 RepID=A0A0M3JMP0_ANISI|nr:unnamed protein product [Anisakis simplex]